MLKKKKMIPTLHSNPFCKVNRKKTAISGAYKIQILNDLCLYGSTIVKKIATKHIVIFGFHFPLIFPFMPNSLSFGISHFFLLQCLVFLQ